MKKTILILLCVTLVFVGMLVFLKWMKTTESFVCVSKEYTKVYEEGDVIFAPMNDITCGEKSDMKCKEYKNECLVVDVDEETFYDEDSPYAIEFEKMMSNCMVPDKRIKLDTECLRKVAVTPTGALRGSKTNTNYLYNTIMKKCGSKSTSEKYVLDENCGFI
uniref:Uncharacterized protein n=1 Tax=Pyramimonas orientalis virus TaxID=455367 RepID=A0A7M3UP77_POV01|nr:hypothetical protein HWQ62_00415 [Pyramimonas orientalis virus]